MYDEINEFTNAESTSAGDVDFETELDNYPPTPENTDKIKKPIPQWVLSVAASLVTCVILFTLHAAFIVPNLRPRTVISYVSSEGSQGNGVSSEPETAGGSFSRAMSSVVTVESASSYRSFFGISTTTNTGSGIILSEDGYILTTASLGDGEPTVTLPDGSEYDATAVGADTRRDIAILKIEASGLPALALGDSGLVKAGDKAIVVSNILGGGLGSSITTGVICGVNNGVTVANNGAVNLLQTDALTGTGSAGGCILNSNGEVIGMITAAVTSESDDISFAIPSNDIKNAAESLISTGKAPETLMIGITGSDSTHGVLVESVIDDSPASKAGIKTGDLILKVQDTPVTSISEINKIRDSHKKGDTLKITIYTDGEIRDVNVVL